MSSRRITIRIPLILAERLRKRSRMKGQPESELVREALERYLARSIRNQSAYELAVEAGLIGCVRHASKDLSTKKEYFKIYAQNLPSVARLNSRGRLSLRDFRADFCESKNHSAGESPASTRAHTPAY